MGCFLIASIHSKTRVGINCPSTPLLLSKKNWRWAIGGLVTQLGLRMDLIMSYIPAGHNRSGNTLIDSRRRRSSASAGATFIHHWNLDLISCLIWENAIRVAGRCSWVGRQRGGWTRDNEKSRTGLLGVADIDEYLAWGGNRRRGGAWWKTLGWTWRSHRLMICRLPHLIYSWGLAFCHNLFVIISHLPFMNRLHISEDEGGDPPLRERAEVSSEGWQLKTVAIKRDVANLSPAVCLRFCF